MAVSFEEAAFGVEKTIELTKFETCDTCKGSGAKDPSDIKTCSQCGGKGVVETVQQTILGAMRSQVACPNCGGEGKEIKHKCSSCNGAGIARKKSKVSINIPAGVEDGMQLRIPGKGDAGPKGGGYGDLYIHVSVKASEQFTRKGADIYSEYSAHVSELALGNEVSIPTIHGKKSFKIPAGTQSHTTFRIAKAGAQRLNASGTGDHYVKVVVSIPEDLNSVEKENFEKLAQVRDIKIKAQKKGFF
ncbi:MAG: DnaJ C-terminal domain-containing protein [Patescibacteria group bacterium]|nr:DnaJ C-terminal domain-containing protein [Patescibacteria group bacterium]